jgi:hypothetical protein
MTDKRIAANRANAQRSTGPRTAEGKKKVSQNALKHGLTARSVTTPDEDIQTYETFKGRLYEELDPQSVVEMALTEQIVNKLWRVMRIPRIEAQLMSKRPLRNGLPWEGDEDTESNLSFAFTASSYSSAIALLTRYESSLDSSIRGSMAMLRAEQERRTNSVNQAIIGS